MNKFPGLVMSQRVLLALTQAGVSREDAYAMGTIVPAISGPKRPQDYIALDKAASTFHKYVEGLRSAKDASDNAEGRWEAEGGQPEPQEIPGNEGHHKLGYVTSENGNYQLHAGHPRT